MELRGRFGHPNGMNHPRAIFVPACLVGLSPLAAAWAQEAMPAPESPANEATVPMARGHAVQEGDVIDPIGGEILNRALSGTKLSASAWGEVRIETMADVLEREKTFVQPTTNRRVRNGRQGEWQIPSRKIKSNPHSGEKCLINRWGDTSMGIGLGSVTDVEDVWIASQGGDGIWAKAVRVVGYNGETQVGATEWFTDIDRESSLMPIGLKGVDRLVVEAKAAQGGAGFYSIDDLRLTDADGAEVVVDFEAADWDARLTGTDFGGFTWEMGTGDFGDPSIIPAPQEPAPDATAPALAGSGGTTASSSMLGGSGTPPAFIQEFRGPRIGDPGANLIPPDTCGDVGTTYYCAMVNSNLSIYDKATGVRQQSVSLQSFFGGSGTIGDPRIAYDNANDRWVALATNFGELCWFAYSTSGDPLGSWLKTSIDLVEGSDAGRWIDYPTLGVDSRGVFIEAYMVGSGARMSIFAIDKAPLLTGTLGTVTAFRNLTWDGAIHHATQYTDAGQSWMISTRSATSMRLRRINAPLSNPTLTTTTVTGIPSFSTPNDAPAMGSTVNINTGGTRLMGACYVNGSIWTSHCVAAGGKSGARWYEIDPVNASLTQSGTLTDPSLWLYYPTISADAAGNAVLGFSGSDANTFPSAYYAGRAATDAPGEMSTAVLYSAGQASYTITDGAGRNRWGDYSQTSLDPVDGSFWTIQERTRAITNSWVTRIAQLDYGDVCAGNVSTYCTAVPNTSGSTAAISSAGTSSFSANDLVLFCAGLPSSTFGLFFYGQSQAQAPVGDGNLCIGNPFYRLPPVQSSVFGDTFYALDLNNLPNPQGQIAAGETWNFSFWFRQVSASGFNFSNGLNVEFCP